jgi:phosphate transport system permease protein
VITAVLLGIARIVGETAPLIFTAFGSQVLNANPFAHPQAALPLIIWSDFKDPQAVLITLAFQAAFVLISIVLILFVLARLFSRPRGNKGKASRRNDDDLLARMWTPVPMTQGDGDSS